MQQITRMRHDAHPKQTVQQTEHRANSFTLVS